MNMRIIIVLIAFILQATSIQAQKSIATAKAMHQNHLLFQSESLFLAQHRMPKSYAQATLSSFTATNHYRHAFMPKTSTGFTVHAHGYKPLKSLQIFGEALFQEQYNDSEIGKNAFTSEYLSPYYLSDVILKNWKWQMASVKTTLSKNLTSTINTSLSLGYTAQHKVNYAFPKSLLYKNTIVVKPSIGVHLSENHKVSFSYQYKNSQNDISIDDGTVSTVRLYAITGLGNLANPLGGASNYRHEREISHKIGLQGVSAITTNNEFFYALQLEKFKQQGFDDLFKNAQVFDYAEWISTAKFQLTSTIDNKIHRIQYQLQYRDGKGTYVQPRSHHTYTEKLEQQLNWTTENPRKKETLGIHLAHIHQREANSIFANYYDIDYLKITGSFKKEMIIQNRPWQIHLNIGYQTPTHFKNRFVKTNHYIDRFILPYIAFHNRDFYLINLTPKTLIPIKKLNEDLLIGWNSAIVLTDTVNHYNGLSVKMLF